MRERMLGSLAALLAAAGLAAAQGIGPDIPPGPTDPPSAVEAAGIRARRAHPAVPPGPGAVVPDGPPAAGAGCPVPDELPPPAPSPDGPPPPWCSLYSNMGPHCWIDGDYLHWWIKSAPIPEPLLTTGNIISLVVPPGLGVLGANGTSVVFGNTTLDQGQADGGRITLGGWLDAFQWPGCKPIGYEVSWFMLGRIAGHFEDRSNGLGEPLLARPVIDAQTNNESAFYVSFPGVFGNGRFSVDTSTQLWGGEANIFVPLIGKKHILLGGLLGFRYLDLEETLEINQSTDVIGNGVAFFNGSPVGAGNSIAIADDFKTHNRFYGGQVGAQATIRFGRTTLDILGKIGMGTMHEEAHIQGSTTVTGPAVGGTSTVGGGLLALAGNTGDFGSSRFAVVPETATTLTYQLTDNFALHIGYTFLYANDVLRPGQQIDRTVNPVLVPTSEQFGQPVFNPGPVRPTFDPHPSDFWAHGLSLGLSLSF